MSDSQKRRVAALGYFNAHDLMPVGVAATMPTLYSQERIKDPLARVRLFTPDSSYVWYLTEYAEVAPDETPRLAFGLTVNQFGDELGYISIDELESIRGPFGLRVERDLDFTPRPLSQVRGN
jgi:hypothetical protein